MNGILAIEADGGCAGAIQGGYEFLTNIFRLTYANDDNFSIGSKSPLKSTDGASKAIVEPLGQKSQLGGFNSDDSARFFDQIHVEKVTEE